MKTVVEKTVQIDAQNRNDEDLHIIPMGDIFITKAYRRKHELIEFFHANFSKNVARILRSAENRNSTVILFEKNIKSKDIYEFSLPTQTIVNI